MHCIKMSRKLRTKIVYEIKCKIVVGCDDNR